MKIKTIDAGIVLLYVLMILVSTQFFFDDLGFDYSGYALRYNSFFESWLQEQHLGIPTRTFDSVLPGFLPFMVKLIGVGSFTLPLTISILIIRMIFPFVFVFLGKKFEFNSKLSFLVGIIFVFNPILFKFFNRFYEFTAWLFFVMAFASFYEFLKRKKFSKKFFGLSVFFVCLTALSHLGALFFVCVSFLFLVETKQEIKKLLLTGLISTGIIGFWVIPFFSFLDYSIVQEQKGMLLTSTGILTSGIFLTIALITVFFAFRKFKEKQPKINRLILGSFILSVIILLFPLIPIIAKPFAHSYHAFFIFVLLLAFLTLIKEGLIQKNHSLAVAAILLITVILIFPIIERQYLFEEPKLSEYNIKEISLLIKEVHEQSRFEVLPYNPVIHPVIAVEYHKLSLNGWGYNAYTLKESDEIGEKMISMKLSCEEFTKGIEKTATNYWIVLDEKAEEYLKKCMLKQKGMTKKFPKLYFYEKNSPLIENGKLVEFSNEKVLIESYGGNVLVKQSFFPRWKAYQNGKELEIEDKKPGIKILSTEKGFVELRYEKTFADWAGIIISLVSIIIFFFLMKKKSLD